MQGMETPGPRRTGAGIASILCKRPKTGRRMAEHTGSSAIRKPVVPSREMDERSQHQAPAYPQQQVDQTALAPAPWPQYAPPQHGAPMAGHVPHAAPMQQQYAQPHQQYAQAQPAAPGPTMQQFQYAAQGFVLPGSASNQQPQMSAHGGMIGAPQQADFQHGQAMPLVNGTAAAFDPALQQAQTWAFPTPHGMQLVQQGAPAHVPMPQHVPGLAGHAHPQQYAQQPLAVVQGAGLSIPPATRRRMRWETIVPAAAVACLCAAIWLFISDFDRITGRDSTGAPASQQVAGVGSDAATKDAGAGDAAEIVKEATALYEQGSFDDAANLLHPILDGDSPDPAAVALHDKVDAANERNKALLTRLSAQRRGKQWGGVVATVGLLEQLRPLSPDLVTLRTQATRAIGFDRAFRTASTLARQGRSTRALAVIAAALKAGPNARLQALQTQFQGTRTTTTGGGRGSSTAPRRGTGMPPKAEGTTGGTTQKLPPKGNAGPVTIPKIPTTNPISSPGTGAGAVGGGPAANCHTHEGVQSCHA
ncbi:MAG: hypothetical protein JWM86_1871 [Thermoleophilia bacterium]|nr:hypothetical protein [Thermoleophilia bacterium]